MEQLDGKVALITGAKGGLGTYVTKAFLAAGANVVGMSRSIHIRSNVAWRPSSRKQTDFPHPRFSVASLQT